MRASVSSRVLRGACFLALVGLALMIWSLLDPTPLPVMVAMSVGQVFGTLSLAAFLFVIVADLRAARLDRAPRESGAPARRESSAPAPRDE